MPPAPPPPTRHPHALDAIALALVPYGAAAIELYEACVRAGEELQRAAARRSRFAPAREAFSRSAELTRDLGAVNAAWGRWLLGL
jgi:hypothetical protein